jgi:hypothetical protein
LCEIRSRLRNDDTAVQVRKQNLWWGHGHWNWQLTVLVREYKKCLIKCHFEGIFREICRCWIESFKRSYLSFYSKELRMREKKLMRQSERVYVHWNVMFAFKLHFISFIYVVTVHLRINFTLLEHKFLFSAS